MEPINSLAGLPIVNPGMTNSRKAVHALINAGIVPSSKATEAEELIRLHTARTTPYNFKNDSEFLMQIMDHHIDTYFGQVIQPAVMSHHTSRQPTGRLLNDKEVEEAAIEITSLVMGELGAGYIEHMFMYFGDTVAITRYIFVRVHAHILQIAIDFNSNFLTDMTKRVTNRKRRADINNANTSSNTPAPQ